MTEDTWVIGLDVGGTKIAGGVVRFPTAEVVCREVIPTRPTRGSEAVLADAVALAGRLSDQARLSGITPSGIGLGVPELVDLEGRVTSGATIDWRGITLGDWFGWMGPTAVDADVRAAARAEALFGAGRPYRLFVYVSVGTGISSCLVQDGRPFAGARGNAIIVASGPESSVCPTCGTKSELVLEDVASGLGLVRRHQAVLPGIAASAKGIVAAAAKGDPTALSIVTRAGEALGNRLGLLANLLDPEAIIIGGGLGLAGGVYWETLLKAARSSIWSPDTRQADCLPAALGSDSGLIGAAALIWQGSHT